VTRRFIICTLFGLAALCTLANTARSDSYGTELPFVAGTGARASGLGLAGVSLIEAPSLMYFNPGVLRRYDYKTVELYRTTLFDSDAQYLSLSYVHPTLDFGTFGVSILRLGVGGIEQRDINNNLLGDVEDGQTRILLGYGVNAHRLVAIGLNLKIDRHTFGGFSGTGVGIDLGVHARKPLSATGTFREVRAGLAIENLIEPTIRLDQEDVGDPLRTSLGTSLVAAHRSLGFTTALDLVAPRFSPVQLRFGQEVTYDEFFAVRFGMQGSTPTFGIGGRYQTVALDYAYRSEDLGSNHRISLTVGFGRSVHERADERNARLDAEMQSRVAQRVSEFENIQIASFTAKADSLFDAGDYEGALAQYDVVLLWEPGDEHARRRHTECRYRVEFAAGDSLFTSGDYVAALYRFHQALQIRPDDADALARVAACQGKIDANTDRAQMIDNMLRGAIDLYASKRYAEAQAGFEEVLRISPDNRIAKEYQYKSRTNVKNDVQRHILRSRTYADKKQYGSAIAELEAALVHGPSDQVRAELQTLRLRQQAGLNQPEDTAPVHTRKDRVASDPVPRSTRANEALEARYDAGLRLFEAGDFERASHKLLEVWTVAPNHRNVSEVLARSYLFLGMKVYSEEKYDEAIRIWEKILVIDPGNSKAQRYLQKTREESARLTEGQR